MEYNTQKLQKLLEEVGKIRKKHEEEARRKGEGFNIFDIFRTDENKHSDFIAELLNSKGSHAQVGKFLELFLDMLVLYEIIDDKLAYQNASVSREVSLGESGRLDILLSAGNGTIYIENKIWASDQNEQIQRYHNVGKDKPNFKLLYLTPHGWESSSAGELITKEHYFPISYEKHIIEWLEACHKETADLPILRETIKQYIIHLKHLTGQAQNNEMEKEFRELIIKNFDSVLLIQKHFVSPQHFLMKYLEAEIKKSYPDIYIRISVSNGQNPENSMSLGIFVNSLQPTIPNKDSNVYIGFQRKTNLGFWLGVLGWREFFDTEKQNFPKPQNFGELQYNDYWLWYEEIKFEKLQDITSPANIERIAKAIEEYAPFCDAIDKNFRKP